MENNEQQPERETLRIAGEIDYTLILDDKGYGLEGYEPKLENEMVVLIIARSVAISTKEALEDQKKTSRGKDLNKVLDRLNKMAHTVHNLNILINDYASLVAYNRVNELEIQKAELTESAGEVKTESSQSEVTNITTIQNNITEL
jgi:hypothetical protein